LLLEQLLGLFDLLFGVVPVVHDGRPRGGNNALPRVMSNLIPIPAAGQVRARANIYRKKLARSRAHRLFPR
jgi:hypothetical protein